MKNTFTLIDDILIVTKGSEDDHRREIKGNIKVLGEAGIRKHRIMCDSITRNAMAGVYIVSRRGKTYRRKVQAITNKLRPKNLEDLISFIGAINQLNNFIPSLAILCALLHHY